MKLVMEGMTPIQKDIWLRRLGLVKGKIETLLEIGTSYNLTRERVRQIEEKGLIILKKNDPFAESKIYFIKNWNKAKSLNEVTRTLGLTESAAKEKACSFRSDGFPLKKFKKGKIAKRKPNGTPPLISNEEFARLWNKGMPIKELAAKGGITVDSTLGKASKLKKQGYNIKTRIPNRNSFLTQMVDMRQRLTTLERLVSRLVERVGLGKPQ
jgi:phage terminase small subunit